MPSVRLAPAVLALIALGGCERRTPSVFVDVDAIVAAEPAARRAAFEVPAPPEFSSRPGGIQPGLPSRVLRDETQARMEDARRLIEANRERALREITLRLRRVYREEADRIEERRLKELEPEHRARIEAAQSQVRALFDRYAERRAPLIARLAFLAGFPDPDPRSRRESTSENARLQRRLEEAKAVRAQLQQVEAEYEQQVSRLVSAAQDTIDEDLTRIRAETETVRSLADERAEHEAARQVRARADDLGLTLANRAAVMLPEVPSRRGPSVSSGPLPAGPDVKPSNLAATKAAVRDAVEHDLEVWLSVRGFERAKSKSGGRDATEEFRTWRESHRLGR